MPVNHLLCITFLYISFYIDFKMPWQSLAESREQYSLRWETKYLMELGEAFDYILNGAISMATQEALKYTILSGLVILLRPLI